jgi:hypothetical protein
MSPEIDEDKNFVISDREQLVKILQVIGSEQKIDSKFI